MTTPVTNYYVGGRLIRVKRDDLAGKWPAPGLGKLRGIARHMENRGDVIGAVDRSPASRNVWAHAFVANQRGLRCIGYGTSIGVYQQRAIELGCEYKLTSNDTPDEVYAEAMDDFHETFPNGWMAEDDCHTPAIVDDIRRETVETGQAMACDTLVVPTGSGGTAVGVLHGLVDLGLLPSVVVLHTSGSRRSHEYLHTTLSRRFPQGVAERVRLIREGGTGRAPPFPANPKYEVPAWTWVTDATQRTYDDTPGVILFWNAGE